MRSVPAVACSNLFSSFLSGCWWGGIQREGRWIHGWWSRIGRSRRSRRGRRGRRSRIGWGGKFIAYSWWKSWPIIFGFLDSSLDVGKETINWCSRSSTCWHSRGQRWGRRWMWSTWVSNVINRDPGMVRWWGRVLWIESWWNHGWSRWWRIDRRSTISSSSHLWFATFLKQLQIHFWIKVNRDGKKIKVNGMEKERRFGIEGKWGKREKEREEVWRERERRFEETEQRLKEKKNWIKFSSWWGREMKIERALNERTERKREKEKKREAEKEKARERERENQERADEWIKKVWFAFSEECKNFLLRLDSWFGITQQFVHEIQSFGDLVNNWIVKLVI